MQSIAVFAKRHVCLLGLPVHGGPQPDAIVLPPVDIAQSADPLVTTRTLDVEQYGVYASPITFLIFGAYDSCTDTFYIKDVRVIDDNG